MNLITLVALVICLVSICISIVSIALTNFYAKLNSLTDEKVNALTKCVDNLIFLLNDNKDNHHEVVKMCDMVNNTMKEILEVLSKK